MIYLPHDLLRIDRVDRVLDRTVSRPDWVDAALARAPWVVVRRALSYGLAGKIAVGVRGVARSERYGMWIDTERVHAHVRPEHLVAMADASVPQRDDVPAVALARALMPVFDRFGLMWGPTGSVGFEWASGVCTAHASSDLDLIIRCDRPLPQTTAAEIFRQLECRRDAYGGCRIDANVETPSGAFSLAEYATTSSAILLRTASGPRLTNDPWEAPAVR